MTKSQPVCPDWCEVPDGQHEEEAWERIGSWFHHRHTVRSDKTALIYVGQIQYFEEQRADEDPEAAGAFIVFDINKEVLTPDDARAIQADLGRAIKEAGR